MRSMLFDNHNAVQTEANHQPATFSLLDMIGSRSREPSPTKKSFQYDFPDSKKYEGYQPDFSQSRSPKEPYMSTKLREHRSIPNNISSGLEDSLDVFQKERLRGGLSPSRVEEKYSPSIRNSPNKLGSQGDLSPGKKEQPYPFLDLNASTSENKYKNSISSLSKVQMHSPKNSRLESEIIMGQKSLEKRFDPTTRVRDYNIVTGEKASPNTSVLAGLPFGYVARSLERGLEDVHIKQVLQYKKLDPESPVHSPLKRQESYFTPKEQTYEKKLDNIGVVAGKNSSYKETEYRYANKQNYEPLSQNQMYSVKALKNLSAVKLY